MEGGMRVEIPEDRPLVEVPLPDGRVVQLAPLSADDRHYLVEGLDEMSIESRFSRFGQGRDSLSAKEWDYLTDVDQRRHVAWAAVIDGHGVGVGRYIVVDDTTAEVAVTVLDGFQGKGVGTILFGALAAVARADGVERFRFAVVPSNTRVRELLKLLNAEIRDGEGLVEGTIEIDGTISLLQEEELIEAMSQFRGSR
jgi:GNAT superfamily N-acetyltransferase